VIITACLALQNIVSCMLDVLSMFSKLVSMTSDRKKASVEEVSHSIAVSPSRYAAL